MAFSKSIKFINLPEKLSEGEGMKPLLKKPFLYFKSKIPAVGSWPL